MSLISTNFFHRLTGWGNKLTPFELKVIDIGLSNLPKDLRLKIKTQINEYNLVQREHDWRAINFYKTKGFFRGLIEVSQEIKMNNIDAPIIKLKLITDNDEIIHATFHVVNGRFFCITFSTSIKPYKGITNLKLLSVTDSWRSSILA